MFTLNCITLLIPSLCLIAIVVDFISLSLSVRYARKNNKEKSKAFFNIMIGVEKVEKILCYLSILVIMLKIITIFK